MAIIYETYGGADSTFHTIPNSSTWYSQTFTVGNTGTNEDFILYSIWLFTNGAHYEDPQETITASIRAVDGTGKPTGADLITITKDGPWGWHWEEFLATDTYSLQASTKYAIVIRCLNLDASEEVLLEAHSAGTYTGGDFYKSTDSGSSWTIQTSQDLPFIIYGNKDLPTPVGYLKYTKVPVEGWESLLPVISIADAISYNDDQTLRVAIAGTVYCADLTGVGSADASQIRVQSGKGLKAWRGSGILE